MLPRLPIPVFCPSAVFGLLQAQLPCLERQNGLLGGMIAIAQFGLGEDVSLESADQTIQQYADIVRSRVRGSQQQATLAHLHEFLFAQMGFRGNPDDYSNPRNSYLPAVLESRRGIPVTLSLIYVLVARRLGLRAFGVGMPGHFLAGIEQDGSSPMYIDVFDEGRIIEILEIRDRLHNAFDDSEVQFSEELLKPASHRHWLTRTLQNLLNNFRQLRDFPKMGAIFEMEILLWPEQNHLVRDLGYVLARLGLKKQARQFLMYYREKVPHDPEMSKILELIYTLR